MARSKRSPLIFIVIFGRSLTISSDIVMAYCILRAVPRQGLDEDAVSKAGLNFAILSSNSDRGTLQLSAVARTALT